MTIQELQKEMITAMKARDKVRKESISNLIAAVKKVAIDRECRDNITEDLVDEVILKETKLAREQVDTCPDSRPELKEEYTLRYNIYKEFAPAQMDKTQVEEFIKKNFADLVEAQNKGALMKSSMQALKGKADGKLINEVVSKICG